MLRDFGREAKKGLGADADEDEDGLGAWLQANGLGHLHAHLTTSGITLSKLRNASQDERILLIQSAALENMMDIIKLSTYAGELQKVEKPKAAVIPIREETFKKMDDVDQAVQRIEKVLEQVPEAVRTIEKACNEFLEETSKAVRAIRAQAVGRVDKVRKHLHKKRDKFTKAQTDIREALAQKDASKEDRENAVSEIWETLEYDIKADAECGEFNVKVDMPRPSMTPFEVSVNSIVGKNMLSDAESRLTPFWPKSAGIDGRWPLILLLPKILRTYKHEVKTLLINHMSMNAADVILLILLGPKKEGLRVSCTAELDAGEKIHACTILPDSRLGLSGDYSTSPLLRIWDLEHGRVMCEVRTEHTKAIRGCCTTPDGRFVVLAANDHLASVWDLETNQRITTFQGHDTPVKCCAVTPDGNRVVSGAASAQGIKVWDLRNGHTIKTITDDGKNHVVAIALTPDGRTAITASDDNNMRVWDIERGVLAATLSGHTGGLWGIAVTPDGKTVVSASNDRTCKVWDLEARKEIRTLEGHTSGVGFVVVDQSGLLAISVDDAFFMRIWELQTGECVAAFKEHTNVIPVCAVSNDGRTILTGSLDQTLRVWAIE